MPEGGGEPQDARRPSSLASQLHLKKNESDPADVPQPRARAQPVPAQGTACAQGCQPLPSPAPSPVRAQNQSGRGFSCPGLSSLSSRSLVGFGSSPNLGKLAGWDDHNPHFQPSKPRPTEEKGFAQVSWMDTTDRLAVHARALSSPLGFLQTTTLKEGESSVPLHR